MITTENVMDFLVAQSSRSLPADGLAEVFDRLIWCLDDNGEEIEVVRGKWLKGEDKDKVEIALAMDQVFPGNSRDEMVQLFQRITSRWPEFRPRCEEILSHWDEQYGSAELAPPARGRPNSSPVSAEGALPALADRA